MMEIKTALLIYFSVTVGAAIGFITCALIVASKQDELLRQITEDEKQATKDVGRNNDGNDDL